MFYRSGWLRCVVRICIGAGSGCVSVSFWWMVRVLFRFRAGVDIRCYIVLYYYIIIYYYILLLYSYTILFSLSYLPLLLFLSSSPFPSIILYSLPSSILPFYLPLLFFPILFYSFPVLSSLLPLFSSFPIFILYVSVLTYTYLYSPSPIFSVQY